MVEGVCQRVRGHQAPSTVGHHGQRMARVPRSDGSRGGRSSASVSVTDSPVPAMPVTTLVAFVSVVQRSAVLQGCEPAGVVIAERMVDREVRKVRAGERPGEPYTPGALTHLWRKLAKAACVRPIRLHDARHSCGTALHLRGVPLAVIAKWLGHANPAITARIYAHSQDEALAAAAASLGAVVTSGGVLRDL